LTNLVVAKVTRYCRQSFLSSRTTSWPIANRGQSGPSLRFNERPGCSESSRS